MEKKKGKKWKKETICPLFYVSSNKGFELQTIISNLSVSTRVTSRPINPSGDSHVNLFETFYSVSNMDKVKRFSFFFFSYVC